MRGFQVVNQPCVVIHILPFEILCLQTFNNWYCVGVGASNCPQCEDERFELDMVIEAGASAIKLLEPMEEELRAIDNTAGINILQVAFRFLMENVYLTLVSQHSPL